MKEMIWNMKQSKHYDVEFGSSWCLNHLSLSHSWDSETHEAPQWGMPIENLKTLASNLSFMECGQVLLKQKVVSYKIEHIT